MCVVKDGQREPCARSSCSTASTRSTIVTPGTTSGVTAAIVRSTVAIARPIAASSSSVLTRRSSFTSVEPVRSRSKPTTRPRLSTVSAQTRSPTATTGPSPRATRSNAAKPSSVSLTTTTSPSGSSRRSKAANMRGNRNTGSAFGRKKRARDPAVRVRRLAEVRHLPLDAGEVLEIGRRREEERVDAFRLHALAQARAPRCVVEHHETVRTRAAPRGRAGRRRAARRSRAAYRSRRAARPRRAPPPPAPPPPQACRRRRSARARRRRAARPRRRADRPRRAHGSAPAAGVRRARSDRVRRPRRRTSPPRAVRPRGRDRRPRRRR